MPKPTTTHYCACCGEWDYEYVCHVCGSEMTPPATERERERYEDDAREYGHPGDVRRGLED